MLFGKKFPCQQTLFIRPLSHFHFHIFHQFIITHRSQDYLYLKKNEIRLETITEHFQRLKDRKAHKVELMNLSNCHERQTLI